MSSQQHTIATPPSSPKVIHLEYAILDTTPTISALDNGSSSWSDVSRSQTPKNNSETESEFGAFEFGSFQSHASAAPENVNHEDEDEQRAEENTEGLDTWVPSDIQSPPEGPSSEPPFQPRYLSVEFGALIVATMGELSESMKTLMQHSSMANAKLDDQVTKTEALSAAILRRKNNICTLSDRMSACWQQQVTKTEPEIAALRKQCMELEEKNMRLKNDFNAEMALLKRQISETQEQGRKSEERLLEKLQDATKEMESMKEVNRNVEEKVLHKLRVEAQARIQLKESLDARVEEEMRFEAESRREVKESLEKSVSDLEKKMGVRLSTLQQGFTRFDETDGKFNLMEDRWRGASLGLQMAEELVKDLKSGAATMTTITPAPVQTTANSTSKTTETKAKSYSSGGQTTTKTVTEPTKTGFNGTPKAIESQVKQLSSSSETSPTTTTRRPQFVSKCPTTAAWKQLNQPSRASNTPTAPPPLAHTPAFERQLEGIKKHFEQLGLSVQPLASAPAVVAPTAFEAQFKEVEKQFDVLNSSSNFLVAKPAEPVQTGSKHTSAPPKTHYNTPASTRRPVSNSTSSSRGYFYQTPVENWQSIFNISSSTAETIETVRLILIGVLWLVMFLWLTFR